MDEKIDIASARPEDLERAFHQRHVIPLRPGPESAQRTVGPGSSTPKPDWEPPIPFDDHVVPVFPVSALPAWLAEWVAGVAEATQTPPDLAAMLSLAILAMAGAKLVRVEIRPGWREPVNLFCIVGLGPGNRKSSVFAEAARPVFDMQAEECRQAAPEIAKAEVGRKLDESRHKKLLDEVSRCKDSRTREGLTAEAEELACRLRSERLPEPPRRCVDDVTPEKLLNLMAMNGGRAAILSAEGGIFDIMAGRYSDLPNLDVFLKGHAGDTISVDRVGRVGEFIRAPALTLGLAVQPEVIRGLAQRSALHGRGLLARVLWSLPSSSVGFRRTEPEPVAKAVADTYNARIRGLLSAPVHLDANREISARDVPLHPAAYEVLRDFQTEVEQWLRPDGELGLLQEWGGKLVGAVARIAALLAIADDEQAGSVDLRATAGAVAIGRYLAHHAQSAFGVMAGDVALEDAKRIWRWIERRGPCAGVISRREIHQGVRTRTKFQRAGDLDAPLTLLEERGYIRMLDPPERRAAHRPAGQKYSAHPSARGKEETP